tara:strand:+ start:317 stop:451 length:135 start_codon:yes stop_codon:yes gene_type:complete
VTEKKEYLVVYWEKREWGWGGGEREREGKRKGKMYSRFEEIKKS